MHAYIPMSNDETDLLNSSKGSEGGQRGAKGGEGEQRGQRGAKRNCTTTKFEI